LSTAETATCPALPAPDKRDKRIAAYIQVGVLAALMLCLFWHELRRLLYIWQSQSNWSHGFVVPLFSLYFLYSHREELAKVRIQSSPWGLVILLSGLGIYLFSIYPWQIGYTKSVAIIICLFGLVLYRCGWRLMRIAWLPILYLMFAVPLPDRIYVKMTMPLRHLASMVASNILSLHPNVEATVSGVTIDLIHNGQQLASLNVADACSGMRVLIGLCALGVAIAYLGDRPNWQRITLVLFCIPIGVFTNLLRVTSTGAFHVLGWKLLTENAGHMAWGLVMYAVALALFFLLSLILSHLVVEDRETTEVEARAPA
jgi:exosortase